MYLLETLLEPRKQPLVRDGQVVRATNPENVAAECREMAGAAQEMLVAITLNAKNIIIDKHIVTVGLADSSLVHPRELFRKAIQDNAAAIVLVHNHPSGDTTPSAEDIRITRQIVEAGKIIDIKVLDHIIVGTDDLNGGVRHHSMRESGMVSFQ